MAELRSKTTHMGYHVLNCTSFVSSGPALVYGLLPAVINPSAKLAPLSSNFSQPLTQFPWSLLELVCWDGAPAKRLIGLGALLAAGGRV